MTEIGRLIVDTAIKLYPGLVWQPLRTLEAACSPGVHDLFYSGYWSDALELYFTNLRSAGVYTIGVVDAGCDEWGILVF